MKSYITILCIVLSFASVLCASLTEPNTVSIGPSGAKQLLEKYYDYPSCGPAAITLVLKLYGKSYSVKEICENTYIDNQKNSTVKSICNTLNQYGIYARGCKLSVDELIKRNSPTIILMNNYQNEEGRNHFMIYVGHDENNIKLIDPLFRPFKTIPREKFERYWQSVSIITQLEPFTELEEKASRMWNLMMYASIVLLISTVGLTYKKVFIGQL